MLPPSEVVPPLSKALRYSMATDLRCSSVMVCLLSAMALPSLLRFRPRPSSRPPLPSSPAHRWVLPKVVVSALASALEERRNPGVDVHPHRLGIGVVVHCLKSHLPAIAARPHPAERRTGVDPLVAIDPDHARAHVLSHAMSPLQVAGPQAAAQAVGRAVGDGDGLIVGLEGGHRYEGTEDLLLA